MRPPIAASALALLLWVPGPGAPAGAAAQDTLDEVNELAGAGRAEEARALLTEWWAGEREEASREDLQRGIWLRGVLTVDPDQASLEFWRLVVEYPTGPYTVRALARIGAAAEASGDRDRAVRAWETLVREHRETPEAARAREKLAAAPAGTDVPGVVEDEAGPARGDYTVQLGAFATTGRARQLMERVRAVGLEPRLVRVPGSGLLRVRIGRFVEESPAVELRRRAAELGFEALVAEDAASEEPAAGG